MPTGYTAKVKEGISFKEFAMDCSRAFGALVAMRDEPAGAEIPEVIEPSPYHSDKLKEIEVTLKSVQSMSDEEASHVAAQVANNEREQRAAAVQEITELRDKYEAMLAEAQKWQPPTPDHQGLKDFMINQIENSIDFDCRVYRTVEEVQALSGPEWRQQEIERLSDQKKYHEEGDEKERQRAAERTKWITDLRSSLKENGQ